MSSTSTFKGMNSEDKPSSRVLAPPGGGSSNIFGTTEPVQAPRKKEVAAPKPAEPQPTESVSQSNQGERFVRAAPKQGEDSFQNLFGSDKSIGSKNSSQSRQEIKSKQVNFHADSNQSSPTTFDSLFGDAKMEVRKKSATPRQTDSFKTLFGHKNGDSNASNSSSYNLAEQQSHKIKNLSLDNNPQLKYQNSSGHDSSFHRVFGEFQGDSTPTRSKRQSDNNAFNPITGQPYEMTESKKKDENDAEKVEEKENEQKREATAKPTEPKEKTSTRIAQPPGGKSSGLW